MYYLSNQFDTFGNQTFIISTNQPKDKDTIIEKNKKRYFLLKEVLEIADEKDLIVIENQSYRYDEVLSMKQEIAKDLSKLYK